MDDRLRKLAIFLKSIGIQLVVENNEFDKPIQPAIYLGQRSGVDLGYRHTWNSFGLYCESLIFDFYKLLEFIDSGKDFENGVFNDSEIESLKKVSEAIKVPGNVEITFKLWLDLLASIDFWIKVGGKNWNWSKVNLKSIMTEFSTLDDEVFEKAKESLEKIDANLYNHKK